MREGRDGERGVGWGGVGGTDIDTWFIVKAIDPYTRKEVGGE